MSSTGTRQVHLLILSDDIRTVHCSERFLHWSLNTSVLATFVCKSSRLHVWSFSALMILFFMQQKDIFKVLVGLKAIQEVTLFIFFAWRLWKVILMTKAKLHLLLQQWPCVKNHCFYLFSHSKAIRYHTYLCHQDNLAIAIHCDNSACVYFV